MNREEYEAKMKQGMEDIVTDVSQFVADSVMLNAKIREMPINPSNADGAEFIKKSEIPAADTSIPDATIISTWNSITI